MSLPRQHDEDGMALSRMERGAALAILFAATLTGVVLRSILAFGDDGIFWPDEIYRTLEMGHRVAFGYGLRPWEFVEGAVSWIYPAFLGGVLAVASLLGLQEPAAYIGGVRAVFVLLGAGSGLATWYLARSLGATSVPAAAGAASFLLAAPAIYFSHRTFSETASILPIVVGLTLTLPPGRRSRALVAGGVLLGTAALFRPQNALFAIGVLATLALRRDGRRVLIVGATLVGAAILGGLVDWLTWGAPFQSILKYIDFNLVEGRASDWGTSPASYYGEFLLRSCGPALALLLVGLAAIGARKAAGLAGTLLLFLVIHAIVPHKESRFVMPALAPLCALAAVGLTVVSARSTARRWVGAGALLLASVLSATSFRSLTWRDLGGAPGFPSAELAYDFNGEINRLLLAAHGQPDLCGLRYEGFPRAYAGGYSYLHRRVPIAVSDEEGGRAGEAINYVITLRPGSAVVVARQGDWALARVADGCTRSPAATDLL